MTSIKAYFYTRAGCHLCDEARDAIGKIAPKYKLSITEIDVDDSQEDMARYGDKVPVLVFEGGQPLESFINEKTLRRALDRLPKNAAT